jgi:hypothetical protein
VRPAANYPGAIRRPSLPTVVSPTALFVALGGTSDPDDPSLEPISFWIG